MKYGILAILTFGLTSIALADTPQTATAPATTTNSSAATSSATPTPAPTASTGPSSSATNPNPSVNGTNSSTSATNPSPTIIGTPKAAPPPPPPPTPEIIPDVTRIAAPEAPSAPSAAAITNATPGQNSVFVPSFVGTYRCKGFDPYLNQNYTGTVVVSQQNTVYRLEMSYDTGEKALGTGGLYDKHLLSVVFQDTSDPHHVGLEQYHFTEDYKTMSGYWVYLGKDKLGKEICDKQ